MRHRTIRRLSIAALALVAIAPLAAQESAEAWYGRLAAKSKDFEALKAYPGSFQIELPKEWQLVPGHAGTLFVAAEKTKRPQPGAAITLEYQGLPEPVDPSLLPSVAAGLVKNAQTRESSGTGFSQQVISAGDRSVILIQYDRPGLTGQDHVVQYSLSQGTTMYHLICIAPKDAVAKYRPIFAYTAASFVPVKTAS